MTNTQKVKDSIVEILKKELEYQKEGYNKIKIARGSEKEIDVFSDEEVERILFYLEDS